MHLVRCITEGHLADNLCWPGQIIVGATRSTEPDEGHLSPGLCDGVALHLAAISLSWSGQVNHQRHHLVRTLQTGAKVKRQLSWEKQILVRGNEILTCASWQRALARAPRILPSFEEVSSGHGNHLNAHTIVCVTSPTRQLGARCHRDTPKQLHTTGYGSIDGKGEAEGLAKTPHVDGVWQKMDGSNMSHNGPRWSVHPLQLIEVLAGELLDVTRMQAHPAPVESLMESEVNIGDLAKLVQDLRGPQHQQTPHKINEQIVHCMGLCQSLHCQWLTCDRSAKKQAK
mmetsp:Transcript_40587/g.107564  ORF Transcript_40587/g.107564 Transcript_40587/m.107564 type:complete len:285 (+) Transcript_40587:394-1248(+)